MRNRRGEPTRVVRFIATEPEYEMLAQSAARAGRSLSAHLRELLHEDARRLHASEAVTR